MLLVTEREYLKCEIGLGTDFNVISKNIDFKLDSYSFFEEIIFCHLFHKISIVVQFLLVSWPNLSCNPERGASVVVLGIKIQVSSSEVVNRDPRRSLVSDKSAHNV